jgi:hypothetical protein
MMDSKTGPTDDQHPGKNEEKSNHHLTTELNKICKKCLSSEGQKDYKLIGFSIGRTDL